MDQGSKGLIETIQNLRKYKLGYTGTQTMSDELKLNETWWYLHEVKSDSISKPKYMAFVACTEMTNGFPDHKKRVLHCYRDQEEIEKIVERLRLAGNVAATLLLPHWGQEYDFKIDDKRKNWAQKMIDLGTLAVIGSHPHVVQKVDFYKSPQGATGLIAYSLGNFISNQRDEISQFSIMLFMSALYDHESKKYKIEDVKTLPFWIDRQIQKNGTSKYLLKKIFDKNELPQKVRKIYENHADESMIIRSSETIRKFFLPTLLDQVD